ncbi:hypothetical protein [Halopiger djelfimassiliensis]|uniref:hypothetical protein n=1 Tax=Halopiger djelfimassiliensis TaxID=1293047 RepID=UPI000677B101|nr:hypothetical protein [Halopiger djelfimassiliensis]
MSLRLRLGADDDEDERPEDERPEDEHRTITGWFLNPTDLGGIFVRSALVFTVLTVLSMIALAVILLSVSEEPFVDQPTIEEPITAYVWLLSYTAAVVSVLGYAAWSFWKQRQLKTRMTTRSEASPLKKPIRLFRIVFADSSECNEYEKQVQKTVSALIIGLLFGNLPARIYLSGIL